MDSLESAFSVPHFFKLFENGLHKIDTFPLSVKNLHIQQDAFARLAQGGEEYIEADDYDVPFATIDFLPTKDRDLAFGLAFFAEGAYLYVDNVISLPLFYARDFANEKDAAEQLLLVLQMLATGKLTRVTTKRHGRLFAVELMLKTKNGVPQPIFTYIKGYRLSWTKDDEEIYGIDISANNFDVASPTSKPLFLTRLFLQPGYSLPNRTLDQSAISPLTARKFREVWEAYKYSAEFSSAVDDPTGFAIYTQPDFYITALAILAALTGLSALNILPRVFIEHIMLSVLIASLLGGFLSPLTNSIRHGRKRRLLAQQAPPFLASKQEPKSEASQPEAPREVFYRRLRRAKKIELSFSFLTGVLAMATGILTMIHGNKASLTIITGLGMWVIGAARVLLVCFVVTKKLPFVAYPRLQVWLYIFYVGGFALLPIYSVSDELFAIILITMLLPIPSYWYRSYLSHKEYKYERAQTKAN